MTTVILFTVVLTPLILINAYAAYCALRRVGMYSEEECPGRPRSLRLFWGVLHGVAAVGCGYFTASDVLHLVGGP